jgi:lipopolysaccharide biosynthesis glycosyltransferase
MIKDYIDHVYKSIKKYTKDFKFYIICDKSIIKSDINLNKNYNYILDVDIPEIDTSKIQARSKIRSKTMYYRFLAPLILDYDKLIYVDTDVIFNANIKELWNIDLKNNLLVATKDQLNNESRTMVNIQTGSNIEFEGQLYASGILVINAKLWREENIFQQMIDYYNIFPMLDLLLMNIICKNRIIEIDRNWCVPANYVENLYCKKNEITYKPKCWHWHGKKPWDLYGALRNQLIYEEYN